MLEINTIEEFKKLPPNLQGEVLTHLRSQDRLDKWLQESSNKAKQPITGWQKCGACHPLNPGWKWKEVRDDSDIHPSQINKCIKFLWFSCMGMSDQFESNIPPYLRRIFDIGHAWHHVMQEWYGKGGAWGDPDDYSPEAKIDPDAVDDNGLPKLAVAAKYWIRGATDAVLNRYIFTTPSLGTVSIRVVHEYKTMNSGNYSKLRKPKPDHKQQATIYSAVFNTPVVVYFYLNKDNSHMVDFPVAFDDALWGEITKKIETVQEFVTPGKEPPWDITAATLNPSECSYCAARKICNPPRQG
jgi:CRISPR/Cas system-associated exonuclease Cas4 (RecB family)